MMKSSSTPVMFVAAAASLVLLLLCCSAVVHVAEAAPPPKGTRSLAESKSLKQSAQNQLATTAIAGVHELNAKYFDQYLKPIRRRNGRDRYWLVVFYASWCATCDELVNPLKALAALIHARESDELEGTVSVVHKQRTLKRGQLSLAKHDATSDEGVAHRHGVDAYPTIILFDKNDEAKKTVFEGDRSSLAAWIDFIHDNTDIRLR